MRRQQNRADVRRIAELERELAETRDYLQSVQEQQDASNEELQTSSEEMQSTNEELQSINEELETSKEELESTNEELVTLNDETGQRNAELHRLNGDLNNLHLSVNMAIVSLGRDLAIRNFTSLANKIFNLLPTDMGRPLRGVKHNLDFADLERWLAEVIESGSVREQEVQDNDGYWYCLRARPYVTLENKIDGAVLVVVDIDLLKRTEQEMMEARNFAQSVVESGAGPAHSR